MTNQTRNENLAVARVLIVDDMPQVRQGLAWLNLTGSLFETRLEIVGEARNGFDAIIQTEALQPNVILMDLEMPALDGFAATRQIKANHPSIWIVALSIHNEPESRQRASLAGSDAFIEKGAPMRVLLQAIHARSSAK